MFLIVAPQRRWAELVAKNEGLQRHEWRYVMQAHDAQGWEPERTTVLVHELFIETPQFHEVTDTNGNQRKVARYPITEAVGVLTRLGATIEYVRT